MLDKILEPRGRDSLKKVNANPAPSGQFQRAVAQVQLNLHVSTGLALRDYIDHDITFRSWVLIKIINCLWQNQKMPGLI